MAATTRPPSGLRAIEPSAAASLVSLEPPPPPRGADLARRLRWLMLGRTLVISVVLGLNVWLLFRAELPTTSAAWLL